jgi:AcrR family transcriptional regulator
MARPTTISTERILEVARRLFLERGIKATTAEVAREAGVAEGSLFKRWKTKQELFRSAMLAGDEDPIWIQTLINNTGKGDLVEHLTAAAMQAIDFFRNLMPIMMMSWSNPIGASSELPEHLCQPNSKPVQVIKKLAGFFENEMRHGRMARRDPEVVARVFVGAMVHFVFVELVTKSHQELPLPQQLFARGIVNLIWNGSRPDTPSKETSR